jgi:hypothetical protein
MGTEYLGCAWQFAGITFEQSASPLLDVQVAPSVTSFMGLSSISIIDCSWTDSVDFRYMHEYPQVLIPRSTNTESVRTHKHVLKGYLPYMYFDSSIVLIPVLVLDWFEYIQLYIP